MVPHNAGVKRMKAIEFKAINTKPLPEADWKRLKDNWAEKSPTSTGEPSEEDEVINNNN